MNAMTENILPAFNGQLDLCVAFTITLRYYPGVTRMNNLINIDFSQVMNFLDEVINQPQRYGVDLAQSPELIYIVAGIKHLR